MGVSKLDHKFGVGLRIIINIRVVVMAFTILFTSVANAVKIPAMMNYQGRVTENGLLVNSNSMSLQLTVYDAPTNGTVIYQEADSVDVVDGLYATTIGDNRSGGSASNLIDAFSVLGTSTWLGISLGNESELTPRERLHASPFAMRAASVVERTINSNAIDWAAMPAGLEDGDDIGVFPATDTIRNRDGVVTYQQRNLQRYIVVASQYTQGTSVALDMSIVSDLCGDEDGCSIVVGMRDWVPGNSGLVASRGPYRLFYSSSTGDWRLSETDATGRDNNGAVQHVISVWDEIYFTDGRYVSGVPQGDTYGFHLLNWSAYTASDVLLIMDD